MCGRSGNGVFSRMLVQDMTPRVHFLVDLEERTFRREAPSLSNLYSSTLRPSVLRWIPNAFAARD